jgi:L-fuconolactonase
VEPCSSWIETVNVAASIDTVCMKVSDVLGGLAFAAEDASPAAKLETFRAHLDVLWDAFGPQRLIYGSNWPVCDRVGDKELVYGQQLSILRYTFEQPPVPSIPTLTCIARDQCDPE